MLRILEECLKGRLFIRGKKITADTNVTLYLVVREIQHIEIVCNPKQEN